MIRFGLLYPKVPSSYESIFSGKMTLLVYKNSESYELEFPENLSLPPNRSRTGPFLSQKTMENVSVTINNQMSLCFTTCSVEKSSFKENTMSKWKRRLPIISRGHAHLMLWSLSHTYIFWFTNVSVVKHPSSFGSILFFKKYPPHVFNKRKICFLKKKWNLWTRIFHDVLPW